jgi:hypothetical protein
MGVSYFPRPQPGSAASQLANKKRKVEVEKNPVAKKAKAGLGQAPSSRMVVPPPKVGPAKKVGILNIARSQAKSGP